MNKIYILHNHHNHYPTVVMGKYMFNGKIFANEIDINNIFETHQFSTEHQQDIIRLFNEFDPRLDISAFDSLYECNKEIFDMYEIFNHMVELYPTKELEMFLFNSNDPNLVISGVPLYDINKLIELTHHDCTKVRAAIASTGYKEVLDILINDEEEFVLQTVAEHGFKEHLDQLILTNNNWILGQVIERGFKEHLDQLIHHKRTWVRSAVAEYGYQEHLKILINDKKWEVRSAVAASTSKIDDLEKLAYDENEWVRVAVARRGVPNLNKILLDDVSEYVRISARNPSKPKIIYLA